MFLYSHENLLTSHETIGAYFILKISVSVECSVHWSMEATPLDSAGIFNNC